MSPKNILKFRVFRYLRALITLLISIIIFLILSKYVYPAFFKLVYLFLIFLCLFIIITIFNYIKYTLVFVKYDKKHLEMELLNPLTHRFEKAKTYLGPEYVISNKYNLYVNRYKDLLWIYVDKSGTKVYGYNKKNKFITVCTCLNKKSGEDICKIIWNYNPDVLIGDSHDAMKKYSNIIKESR